MKKSTVATRARSSDRRKTAASSRVAASTSTRGSATRRQVAQHLGQLAGAELAGAAGAVGERGESDAGGLFQDLIGHLSRGGLHESGDQPVHAGIPLGERLGMPLDAEEEGALGRLDGLDQAVGRDRGGDEAGARSLRSAW